MDLKLNHILIPKSARLQDLLHLHMHTEAAIGSGSDMMPPPALPMAHGTATSSYTYNTGKASKTGASHSSQASSKRQGTGSMAPTAAGVPGMMMTAFTSNAGIENIEEIEEQEQDKILVADDLPKATDMYTIGTRASKRRISPSPKYDLPAQIHRKVLAKPDLATSPSRFSPSRHHSLQLHTPSTSSYDGNHCKDNAVSRKSINLEVFVHKSASTNLSCISNFENKDTHFDFHIFVDESVSAVHQSVVAILRGQSIHVPKCRVERRSTDSDNYSAQQIRLCYCIISNNVNSEKQCAATSSSNANDTESQTDDHHRHHVVNFTQKKCHTAVPLWVDVDSQQSLADLGLMDGSRMELTTKSLSITEPQYDQQEPHSTLCLWPPSTAFNSTAPVQGSTLITGRIITIRCIAELRSMTGEKPTTEVTRRLLQTRVHECDTAIALLHDLLLYWHFPESVWSGQDDSRVRFSMRMVANVDGQRESVALLMQPHKTFGEMGFCDGCELIIHLPRRL